MPGVGLCWEQGSCSDLPRKALITTFLQPVQQLLLGPGVDHVLGLQPGAAARSDAIGQHVEISFGVGVGVASGVGVGVGVGFATGAIFTPLFHTYFFPDLMQVYFTPLYVEVIPALLQLCPAFTAADAIG